MSTSGVNIWRFNITSAGSAPFNTTGLQRYAIDVSTATAANSYIAGFGATVNATETTLVQEAFLVTGSAPVSITTVTTDTLTSTTTNTDLTLAGNGTGVVKINDDLVPTTDATYDIGTSSLKWRDAYLSGTATIGTIAATAFATDTLSSTTTNADLALTANGTGVITIAKSIIPTSTQNIGSAAAPITTLYATNTTTDSITSNTTNANLALGANGTGVITIAKSIIPTSTQNIGSAVAPITNLYTANTYSDVLISNTTNGNLALTANGTGNISLGTTLTPNTTGVYDLGLVSYAFNNVYATTYATGTYAATKIAEAYGGTNQSTYTTGDILYASATDTLSKLAGVIAGSALLSGTTPSWESGVNNACKWNITSGKRRNRSDNS
jgi:hypothetical protein